MTNGSEGTVTGFVYQENNDVSGIEIEMNSTKFALDGLKPNTIIIKRSSAQANITVVGKSTKVAWKRSQFPISEGFCITDYKAQGATLPAAYINLREGSGVSTYVKLSRTKSAASTFIMEGFTLENLKVTNPIGYTEWKIASLAPGLLATAKELNNITMFE